jgi:hypothetical protein
MSHDCVHYRLAVVIAAVIAVVYVCDEAAHATEVSDDFFERQVRPILVKRCGECHGVNEPEKGLTLTTVKGIAKGDSSGRLLVPGKPDQGSLIQAVRYTSKLKMPPDGRLSLGEIKLLEKWVQAGAVLPGVTTPVRAAQTRDGFSKEDLTWWAFRPILDPKPPRFKQPHDAATAVDRFVLRKLQTLGLSLSAEADRRTLIRRLSLDLIGLPPEPDEVDAFLIDERPDAYERLVNRLLASPHYGERWGRHWLDLVRYADTNGGGFDYVYPNAWRYRDYVVRAFNSDKPYDHFLVEQLAGDLLAPTQDAELHADRLTATGFLMLAPKGLGMQDKELMAMDIVDDQIDVLGRSLMGLTLACARCHDHKFDPIPTRDYYSLAGIFRSTVNLVDTDKNPSYWPERPLELASVTEARQRYLSKKAANEKATLQAKSVADQEVLAAAKKRLAEYLLAAIRIKRTERQIPAIAHWSFDELSGDLVKASVGPNAKLSNARVGVSEPKPIPVNGRLGKALRFTGQQEVLAVPASSLNAIEFGKKLDISIAFWIRATPGYSPKSADTVFAAKYSSAMWFVALRSGGFNGIYLRHYDGKRSVDIKPTTNQLPILTDAKWHHVAFTSDRDGIGSVFIDGRNTGSLSIASVSQAADFSKATSIRIGAETNGFRGDLDDVAIWNRLLVPSEIKRLVNAGADPDSARNVSQVELDSVERTKQQTPRFTWETAAAQGLVPSITRNFITLLASVEDDKDSPFKELDQAQTIADVMNVFDEANPKLKKLVEDKDKSPFKTASDFPNFYSSVSQGKLTLLAKQSVSIASTQIPEPDLAMVASDSKSPADLRIHIAGDRTNLGALAVRGFPQIVAASQTVRSGPMRKDGSIPKTQSGRLELARWLTDKSHPLTARVIVNRVWQWHFGEGLVQTPSNFGRLGERPSHPELLDWLASRLIHGGWSIKNLHRRILLSATYKQRVNAKSASETQKLRSVDSGNRWLWRMNSRRLEAEALRDSILAVSGRLNRRIGGTVNTWKPKMFSVDNSNVETANYKTERRSIYLPIVRGAAVHEMLQLFDFSDPNTVAGRRDETTVATQALFMMNNPFIIEQADHFATRLEHANLPDNRARIRLAYRLALGRSPTETELSRAHRFVAGGSDSKATWSLFCQSLFCLNEFVYSH